MFCIFIFILNFLYFHSVGFSEDGKNYTNLDNSNILFLQNYVFINATWFARICENVCVGTETSLIIVNIIEQSSYDISKISML